jgi:hypothetical protein
MGQCLLGWPNGRVWDMLRGVTDRSHMAALLAFAAACGPSAPAPQGGALAAPAAAPQAVVAATEPAAQPAPAEQAACGAECGAQPIAATLTAGRPETFGEPFATDPAADVNIADVLAEPERFADQPLTVRGEVTAVCQRRGCWLEIAGPARVEAKGERAGCRVTSEHHDWLVPRDAAGSTARVRGRVEVRTIPAEQVAHMESEGGRFASKQPDGSARELRLISSGVALAR